MIHRYPAQERVIFGSAEAAIVEETTVSGYERLFIVTNASLGGVAQALGYSFGTRFAGCYTGVTAFAPLEAVLEGARRARQADADILIALGGRSVIDAAKAMLGVLWTEEHNPEPLATYQAKPIDPSRRPPDMEKAIRMIAVPTTFSAAEFTFVTGIHHAEDGAKRSFAHPLFIPQTVVLDPEMPGTAPPNLLMSTGIKALDHAVEGFALRRPMPFSETASRAAFQRLTRALPLLRETERDADVHAEMQMGMWLSMQGVASGVRFGASHAVGHVLGGVYGVPHGLTSCVILPAVLEWNAAANQARQSALAGVVGAEDLPAFVKRLIERLGLPIRLRDIGIERDALGDIARRTMADISISGNPRPIDGPHDISSILERAW